MPRLASVAVLFLALTLAACSDSESPSQSRPSSGPSTTAPSSVVAGTRGQGSSAKAASPPRRSQPFDPSSFALRLEKVADGFSNPLFVTHAGDGSGRGFVVEQGGTIRIIAGDQVLPAPFLDIRSLVRSGGEQGLLGLAFHPQYAENGRFFVMYTARNADNSIAEYHVSASDPNRADPNSGKVLVAIPDFAPNHNGGMLAFGPDGYLYVGTGDGGGAGDPQRNGQKLDALLGKLLRLDVNGGDPYGIPADNPFAGRQGARPEVWDYGLRNPWRFSFDRATGDLWIADVGQGDWEEIDLQPAGTPGGVNYGWSIMEGSHCFRPKDNCDTSGLTMPIADYGHDLGCSVTGGYVYRGEAYPALYGAYLFGDYCSGRIWSLSQDQNGGWRRDELLKLNAQISSFGEDEAGELYLTGLNTGTVYHLTAVPK